MAEKNGTIGGFTAQNSKNGIIEDCYCFTSFKSKNMISGGFAGENDGTISNSYSYYMAKGLNGGFVGKESSGCNKCYFVIDEKDEDDKKVTELWDEKISRLDSEIKRESFAESLGFNFKNTWKIDEEKPYLKFKDESWFYTVGPAETASRETILIKSADDLWTFASRVNEGDETVSNAYVKLTNDIDLRGKSWVPIGDERNKGFKGVFDGNGYSISGILINKEVSSKKGFFGYLLGSVYNLEIDCMIKGDGDIGGLASVNEGIIGCCGVTIQLVGKGNEYICGGFVGTNEGKIFKCFSSGELKFSSFPLIPFLILMCAILIAIVLVVWVSKMSIESGYNRVPSDPDQHQYEDDILTEEEETETETGSVFSFNFMEYISIDRESGECYLDFQNPPDTDCKIVIRLVMSEEVAKEAFEGNSWNNEYYDAETSEITIAESGAVEPGYQLESIYLNEIARSNLHTGEYDGTIILVPYDEETEDLKSVEAALPVTVRIE